METFSALLAICGGNSPVPGWFSAQRPVTRSFDVFFDLRLNKQLSKQSWDWWFETPSYPLWLHSNVSEQCWLSPLMMPWWASESTHGVTMTAEELVTCISRHGYDIDNIIIPTIFLWSSTWGHSCPFPVRHCEVTPLHIWSHHKDMLICMMSAGIILCMSPTNER